MTLPEATSTLDRCSPPDPNPYSAPRSDNYAPELDAELQDASTEQRLLAFVLDYVGIIVLAFGIGIGSVLVIGDADWRTLARLVPFEAFFAFGGGQMWHDSWISTRVVTTR